jgi:hypothetical protein
MRLVIKSKLVISIFFLFKIEKSINKKKITNKVIVNNKGKIIDLKEIVNISLDAIAVI